MRKAAIFDFDKTIVSIDTFHLFLIYLYSKLYIFFIPFLLLIIILRKFRIITLYKFKEYSLNPLKGNCKKTIDSIGEKFTRSCLFRKNIFFKDALLLINEYNNEDYILVLATSCPDIYVSFLAKYLKFNFTLATELEYKNNFYTGLLKGNDNYSENKKDRIITFFRKNKLNLQESIFFTDDISDFVIFPYVKNAYAINYKSDESGLFNKEFNTINWNDTVIFHEKYYNNRLRHPVN